jgi:hypothetical protein
VELIAREWSLESPRSALGLSPADRDAFFNGVKDTGNRGIVAIRDVARR